MKKSTLKEIETVIGYLAIASVAEECGKNAYKSIKKCIKSFKKSSAEKENTAE